MVEVVKVAILSIRPYILTIFLLGVIGQEAEYTLASISQGWNTDTDNHSHSYLWVI